MRLTFNRELVLKLLKHSEDSKKHGKNFIVPTGPGLFLVGDQGVYLMSTGEPRLKHPTKPEGSEVCYAYECNPEAMEFDDWWQAKEDSFGGDDGVEFIPAAEIRSLANHSNYGNFYVDFDEGCFSYGFKNVLPLKPRHPKPEPVSAPLPPRKVQWK